MSKRFDPADRNLAVNPALKKTNSPWPFLIVLVVSGVVVLVCRSHFTPDVSITLPTVENIGDRASATTVAINRTSSPATLKVRIKIGNLMRDGPRGSGRFVVLAEQDVSATIAPHSTAPITCEFLFPNGGHAAQAEAELLPRE